MLIFRNYQDPMSYESIGLSRPMAQTKSYHLEQIRKQYKLNYDQIVLIDDSLVNCKDAVREGYNSIHVAGKSGFECSVLHGVSLKE